MTSTRNFRPALLLPLLTMGGCPARTPPATDDAAVQQAAPREPAEIAALEDARDLGGGRLAALAAATDPAIRRRALLALGRIGAPAGAAPARDRLSDGDPGTRAAAAFALEIIGEDEAALPALSEARLCARARLEPDPEARRRVLRALGRLGGAPGEEALRAALTGETREADPTVRAEAVRALVIYGVRGRPVSTITRAALQQALTDPDAAVRLAAGQALFRMKARAEDVPSLTFALRDADPTVRAAAAHALATAPTVPLPPLRSALADSDWRVRAEAARAVAPLDRAAVQALVEPRRLTGPDAGERLVVAIAALEALAPGSWAHRPAAPARDPERRPAVLHGDGGAADPALARGQALVRCLGDSLRVRSGVDDDLLSTCASDDLVPLYRRQMLRAAALGDRGDSARIPLLTALAAHADGRVRAAALDALGAVNDPDATATIRKALIDQDPGALNAACESVAKAAHDHRGDPTAAPLVAAQVRRLDSVAHVEALLSCIDALRALEDPTTLPDLRARLLDQNAAVRTHARDAVLWLGTKQPRAALPTPTAATEKSAGPPQPPGDPAALAGQRVTATITTQRGPIVLELYPDETPRTVAAFVALSRRGFYNGLTFHRVVADFVAQGGDPRGDGYGGPEFTLRDEPTPRRFERGVVGIALAGKDTGGSQLFICQADSPHLEGKFTAFGRVVSGMQAVDRLVVGDPILTIAIDVR
ncbi:MAG: hypothetical protein EXR72_19265 [Myxococcales bacterium]|nr:hypothetical protein [Myxococcales bacterium]